MDAAEATRNLAGVTQEAGKRERAPAKGVMVSDNPFHLLDSQGGDDARDTSETVHGERERAHV